MLVLLIQKPMARKLAMTIEVIMGRILGAISDPGFKFEEGTFEPNS